MLIILLHFIILGCNPKEFSTDVTAYKGFNIITLKEDMPLRDKVLLVKTDSIYDIVSEGEFNREYRIPDSLIINGEGKFLMPSFSEMHAHLQPLNPNHKNYLKDYLSYGVTTIRIMAGDENLLAWKDSIAQGKLLGPKLKVSSPIIDGKMPLWGDRHNGPVVTKVQNIDSIVSTFKRQGYDLIKLYERLDKDIYYEFLDVAKEHEIPVAAHIPLAFLSQPNLKEVFNSKAPSFEHLGNFGPFVTNQEIKEVNQPDDYLYYGKHLNANPNLLKIERLVERIKQNKIWVTPTSVLWRNNADSLKIKKIRYHNDFDKLDDGLKNWWNSTTKITRNDLEAANIAELILKELAKQDVKLLAGTDFPNPYLIPGYSLHQELFSFVEMGYSNLEALKSATVYPAEYWKETDRSGYLKQGNIANLMILKKNPLNDIRNTLSIEKLIKEGKIIELDKLSKD